MSRPSLQGLWLAFHSSISLWTYSLISRHQHPSNVPNMLAAADADPVFLLCLLCLLCSYNLDFVTDPERWYAIGQTNAEEQRNRLGGHGLRVLVSDMSCCHSRTSLTAAAASVIHGIDCKGCYLAIGQTYAKAVDPPALPIGARV